MRILFWKSFKWIIKCHKITFALVSAADDSEYAFKRTDIEDIDKIYHKLACIYIEEIKEGRSVNRFFESIVSNIIYGIHKTKFCDCGDKYIAIGANGNIYPCEGFIGYKEFCSGNINDDNIKIQNSIHIESSEINNDCVKCWAKNLCAGSCYHECYMRHGDINVKDEFMCDTYRAAIKYGIFIYNELLSKSLIEQYKRLVIEKIPDTSFPIIDYENVFLDIGNKMLFFTNADNYLNLQLDDLACDILTLCNGNNSMFNISASIAGLYDIEKEMAYNDINEFLITLKQNGIIYLLN